MNSEATRQLQILQQMFEQLPPKLCHLLTKQLNLTIETINNQNAAIRQHVDEQLDDIRLAIKSMEFDLEATKTEKADLLTKLRDAGLG